MTYSLTWMPTVLRNAGLVVHDNYSAVGDWQHRGHGNFGPPKGVLLHHTAGSKKGDDPSLTICIKGRSDLAGPLCNLLLARDGTFYTTAAGIGWHAGRGLWEGVVDGNSHLIGIEMENDGLVADDPWPQVQLDAARKGSLALLNYIKAPIIMCAGHKEYALPKGRKVDPDFDMVEFRKSLEALQNAKV